MDLGQVLRQLRSERDRIEKAISALESLDGVPAPAEETLPAAPKKRKLSVTGRKRIIAATKARWARIRAAQSGEAPKPAAKAKSQQQPKTQTRVMSAAARRKISAAAKARWAAKKAKGAKVPF